MSAEKSIDWTETSSTERLVYLTVTRANCDPPHTRTATRADIDKALESLGLVALPATDQVYRQLQSERDTAYALLRSVRSALIGEVSFIPNSLTRDNLRRLIEELRHV